MAEEHVVAYPVQPADHKRKLEHVELEVLEQHPGGSIDRSNEVSIDGGQKDSDFSQTKRPKLEDEAADGLGNGKTFGSGSLMVKGKEDSSEERPDESKEDENQDGNQDGNQYGNHDGNSLIEKVQEPVDAGESEDKMDDVDENAKPEDNQPVFIEAAPLKEVSVEESKEVNSSGSQKDVDDNSKETNDAFSEKEVEEKSKDANDGGSQKEDDSERKDANAGGSQKENGDESKEVNISGSHEENGDENKEVNTSGSHEEIGDESKEANNSGSHEENGDESKELNAQNSHKEVDDVQSMTRRIDVPSSKVGTLIGKGGEMVRHLQFSSGAKIQIRRDAEADPNSDLRPVELIGTVACIEKAEKLIHAVIAEAEAGGVPALAARGVPEQIEIKVPNDKVGVIIGRGGETIKKMQTKSRARIQLIPHEEGDGSKERTVRISGDTRQIDIATALIKDVMYQDQRPSHYSGGFNQPAYQSRGPGGPPQWGSRGPHGAHSMPYNYHGGPYPPQGSHFRPPNSGGYPSQHMPPRSGYGSGWEQRPPHSGPYDYYGRQGVQTPGPVPSHVAPYSQAGAQQSYGQQMYDQPNYDNPTMQQSYGGYGSSQQGYPPAGGQHQMQQPSRPYGMQGSAVQGYGPPRPAAPSGDVPYPGPTQAASSYGTNMAPQQQYGYASGAPGQQMYPSYSSAAPSEGYNGTQATAIAPAYEQHGVQPASGVQQPAGGYGQVPPTTAYSSYSSTQPVYGNAPAQSNGNYGYGSQYPSYGGGNASAYATHVGQTAYSQSAPAQAGYEQSATQPAGYATAPGTAQ